MALHFSLVEAIEFIECIKNFVGKLGFLFHDHCNGWERFNLEYVKYVAERFKARAIK
jgi:hypothetical protein